MYIAIVTFIQKHSILTFETASHGQQQLSENVINLAMYIIDKVQIWLHV